MWKPPELSVSGGFFLIVGWFAVSCGGEAALLVLSAALLHELGHILALRLSGAGICWLRISVLGAVMETRGNLSYGQELLCLLAGPGANLLAAVLFGALDCGGLAGVNAVLCLFNLLPVFLWTGDGAVSAAELAGRTAGGLLGQPVYWSAAAAAVCCLTVWLVWQTGGSLWLLPAALGLLAASIGGQRQGRTF